MNASTLHGLGLHFALPFDDYLADPGVSNSVMSDLAKSPAHCWALHLDPERPRDVSTPAQALGKLAHMLILEPGKVDSHYAIKPAGMSFATKAGKAWREGLPEHLEIAKEDELHAAESMCAAVMRDPDLRRLLSVGNAEVSVFWQDKGTGLRCRGRADWLHERGRKRVTVLDLKTTNDLTHDNVQRSITQYGYHRQAAHYRIGLQACGYEVDEFVFGFVSSTFPYLAAAFVLDDETREQGEQEVAELLDLYANCQRMNSWPLFGSGPQLTGLTKWARRSSEVEISYAS